MSTHRRCVDDVGLIHYADYACVTHSGKSLWRPWCGDVERYALHSRRAPVTCLRCLWERQHRGGPGGLLPYVP